MPFVQPVAAAHVPECDAGVQVRRLGVGKGHALEEACPCLADLRVFVRGGEAFPGCGENVSRRGAEGLRRWGQRFLAIKAVTEGGGGVEARVTDHDFGDSRAGFKGNIGSTFEKAERNVGV